MGNIGADFSAEEQAWHDYNSALVVGADGARVGRYDKIHLVPFGEYIPFQNLLTFAHKLTGRVSPFTRGDERKVFICRLERERIATASSSATRRSLPTRCASSRDWAPRCWSTSATTAGTATPALHGST